MNSHERLTELKATIEQLEREYATLTTEQQRIVELLAVGDDDIQLAAAYGDVPRKLAVVAHKLKLARVEFAGELEAAAIGAHRSYIDELLTTEQAKDEARAKRDAAKVAYEAASRAYNLLVDDYNSRIQQRDDAPAVVKIAQQYGQDIDVNALVARVRAEVSGMNRIHSTRNMQAVTVPAGKPEKRTKSTADAQPVEGGIKGFASGLLDTIKGGL